MRAGALILSIVSYLFLGANPGVSQDVSENVQLSIDFDVHHSPNVPAFVFVKGRLAGVAPGTIILPSEETVPVEIGIAQLKFSPLYSFEFGPEVIKNRQVNIVTTRYEPNKERDAIYFSPNSQEQISLVSDNSHTYSIKLPSRRDTGVGGFLNDQGNEDAFVAKGGKFAISDKYTSGALHFGHSADNSKLVYLQNPSDWSGARFIEYKGGLFNPYSQETEMWTIISNPAGAKIFTPGGEQGKTTSTIPIYKICKRFRCASVGWVPTMFAGRLRQEGNARVCDVHMQVKKLR